MARKKAKEKEPLLPDATKRAIGSVALIIVAIFLTLAAFNAAGSAGSDAYRLFNYLLGFGYFLVPLIFLALGIATLRESSAGFTPLKIGSSIVFVIAGLGFIDMVSSHGGLVGHSIAQPVINLFDIYAGVVILGGVAIIALMILLETQLTLSPLAQVMGLFGGISQKFKKEKSDNLDAMIPKMEEDEDGTEVAPTQPAIRVQAHEEDKKVARVAATLKSLLGTYQAPPLSLLERDRGKPGVGDIKANANLIKRTLANFGIVVELDEISIGPSVTRYAIKPAEGVRLSKIVALQQNLELALAAHPVRIEAPIPGKSLVGIEVPNSSKVTVGLGTMLSAEQFSSSQKSLLVALGRDIAGASHFGNIAKMPHLLIAGATGSGKSVAIHTLITSLLYRNGPQTLRMIMIDPKRVELTLYNRIPHLLSPVLTDPKKAIMALRWAGKEMERRYDLLEKHRVRDIESYHANVLSPALAKLKNKEGEENEVPEPMPYIVIVIDELADIMQSFPRELEAAIVRLAQMSRAVGIHLVLSTQRPSVNVITGLIKANVPARVALQVASQIDSRTIIDQAGAEKLLGAGDMLYLGGEGKPVRLQSAFIGEDEVKSVADFIAKNNDAEIPIDLTGASSENSGGGLSVSSGGGFDEDVDDDMYEAAKQAVQEAGKASTSYIQRKLRVGYARAARLMDMLEERGVIGPADGAKPREVLSSAHTHATESPEESQV